MLRLTTVVSDYKHVTSFFSFYVLGGGDELSLICP